MSDVQQLAAKKNAVVTGLHSVSEGRQSLLAEPQMVARSSLKELSRTSWITCDIQGIGLGLGSTQYEQVCYLTQYIYLDSSRATPDQLPWDFGGMSPRGCGQDIWVRGADESINFYPADCGREPIPSDAMAVQGDTPGPGSAVVAVSNSYYFTFDLGCKPFSFFCGEPVSEPITI